MNRQLVVLGLTRLPIPQEIELSRFVVTSMTGNANFTTPSPTLATITANANALETAYVAAQGGGKDEHAVMYAKKLLLELSLKALAGYVESIANANPVNAESIILSAGMQVKKRPSPRANGFRLSLTGKPGEVLLKTDFDDRATFTWQTTFTPLAEDSWQTIHVGTQAKYLATGLTRGMLYFFRVAKVDKDGQQPWSGVAYTYVP